jgi:site-specific DNA recombinase
MWKHTHYLKGVFWCKRCESRMAMTPANGNGGTYYYYFCLGSRRGICDQPYVLIEDLPQEVLNYYARIQMRDEFRQVVTHQVAETLKDESSVNERVRKRLNARLKELDKQEDRIIDQLGDPDWPQDKLRAKIAKVRHERQTITAQLENLNVSLDVGRKLLVGAAELLANPQKLYQASDLTGRRLMTLTIFGKLYVDTGKITGHELNKPYRGAGDCRSPEAHLQADASAGTVMG